ncbi:hypothetical protein GALL_492730 [mine drainage metagenome]|uniref:Uncharacterized protein n=1 Tax=mine drainage metagenome TaxID=410659 RepID=A0A1J5PMY3_9ZZZZ
MPGRAEAVDAESFRVSRHHQRPPADQARAQQRRDRNVVAVFAKRESIAAICDGVGGEAAIPRIAGEQWPVAEIFHALLAEAANAAGVSKPGNADTVTDPVGGDVGPEKVDAANDFVTGDHGIFDVWQFGIDDVKVGPAHAACAYLDANLSFAGKGIRALLHLQRRARRR